MAEDSEAAEASPVDSGAVAPAVFPEAPGAIWVGSDLPVIIITDLIGPLWASVIIGPWAAVPV